VSWLKTLKECESKGLGRVILTHILKNVNEKDYPIYLHTQPGSFRAIKLYSDFGFKLIRSPEIIDSRKNELKESLPILKEFMIENEYNNLKFCDLENE
jgi:ribosomal protein S18 acetylase RimI-like enzyme